MNIVHELKASRAKFYIQAIIMFELDSFIKTNQAWAQLILKLFIKLLTLRCVCVCTALHIDVVLSKLNSECFCMPTVHGCRPKFNFIYLMWGVILNSLLINQSSLLFTCRIIRLKVWLTQRLTFLLIILFLWILT